MSVWISDDRRAIDRENAAAKAAERREVQDAVTVPAPVAVTGVAMDETNDESKGVVKDAADRTGRAMVPKVVAARTDRAKGPSRAERVDPIVRAREPSLVAGRKVGVRARAAISRAGQKANGLAMVARPNSNRLPRGTRVDQ